MQNLVRICSKLCIESYKEKTPAGFVDVHDHRYGIRVVDGVTFIVIRGTANAANWLDDADVFPPVRSCGGHLAHPGFVKVYRDLCNGGMPTVKGLSNVVATGHSLGGAVATLLAEHTGCKLVTFGSPRVFFRFGSAPKLDHTRVICDDDPVPMVPRLLYRHMDQAKVYTDGGMPIDVKDHSILHYDAMIQKEG